MICQGCGQPVGTAHMCVCVYSAGKATAHPVTPAECNNLPPAYPAKIDLPELVVTKGDGVPLPDQKTAIRRFIQEASEPRDKKAAMVKEAIF